MRSSAAAIPVTALLLHRRPYKENRFICTLLSLEYGRLECVFKALAPEYFREFQTKIAVRDGLASARDFRYTQPSRLTRADAFLFSLYLHELLYYLAPSEVDVSLLYGAYLAALIRLNAHDNVIKTLRTFEFALLQEIGQAIEFTRDLNNDFIQPDQRYQFIVSRGFILDCQGRYDGAQILGAYVLDQNVSGALTLARECLAAQLDSALDQRPLQSRKWLKSGLIRG